jgi:hypothetical protein
MYTSMYIMSVDTMSISVGGFDNCIGVTCANDGTCFDMVDDYQCLCSPGWAGQNCSDTGEFMSAVCMCVPRMSVSPVCLCVPACLCVPSAVQVGRNRTVLTQVSLFRNTLYNILYILYT